MQIEDLIVEVRDSTFTRVGQILATDMVGLKLVARFNNVGSWEITLPQGHPVGETLREPGSGLIVTGPNGVLMSGPTVSATNIKEAGDPNGVWKIQGVDDSVVLGERVCYPTPTTADISLQGDRDIRTGLASTVMYAYVRANIGDLAPVEREIPNLTTAADAGLGSTVYESARFDILGELLTGLASIDQLGFDLKQQDGTLEFSVYQPTDRSAYIRMDIENNTLSKTEYAYGNPNLTHAIVAGQGVGERRQLIEVTTTESLSAETVWGRRIEQFIDERNTADPNELNQKGLEALADGGATITSIDVVPSSDQTMEYGKDWNLGDKVTVVVGGQEVQAIVNTVALSVQPDGIRVGATVGEATGVDYDALVAKKQTTTSQRVNNLERKESNGDLFTWNDAYSTLEFDLNGNVSLQLGQEQLVYVKNSTGATVTNGTVIYPTGSTGVNLTIAKAQANAEATSTQTFAVLTEDIANGSHGFATTFGLVNNIDTSALTEGQPVWLSPTVAGGLTSTKPSAPNHMVLIGFCVRSHATTGTLFVKIQNGFELNELHDVAITAPAAGEVIVRNAGNTGWENQTLTEAGIASQTNLNLKAPIASPTFTGTVTAPTLSVTGNGTVTGNLTVTGETYLNGTEIQGDGKTMLRYGDTWLRVNEDNEFTSGIYAGTGILRTDGNLQVGPSGGTLNVTGSTFTYNGRPVMGLTPAVPTSVTVGSGTASVSATGLVTFSGVSSVSLNGVFTSTYKNYRMVATDLNSAAGNASFCLRLRSGTTDNAGSSYYQYWNMKRLNGAVQDNSGGPNTYYATVGFDANTAYSWSWTGDIVSPFATRNTTVTGLGFGADATSTYNVTSTVLHTVASSFNGITFFPTSSTLSGTVQIYGYN